MSLLLSGTTVAGQADLADGLVELLIAKGVITEQEARNLRKELEVETKEAPAPAIQMDAAKPSSQPPAEVEPPPKPNYLSVGEHVRLNGDLRLRYDGQFIERPEEEYVRHRPRFRLRFGVDAELAEPLKVGFRLASGNGLQNTTNQSFDEHGRGKGIFIDRAYAAWSPKKWLTVMGGKHRNPFYTSPLTWDSDVNLEGVAEQLNYAGEKIYLFGNLSQFFLEEINLRTADADPLMLGYQGGMTFQTPADGSLGLAIGYYDFRNLDLISPVGLLNPATFIGFNHGNGQQMVFDRSGRLLNEFDVVELVGKLRFGQFSPAPLTLFGSYLTNTSANVSRLLAEGSAIPGSDPADLAAYGDDDRSQGYQIGLSLGFEGHKGDWNLGYFYQVLEDYAFPAVFVDSDFHGGGTNNRGHRASFGYFFTNRIIAEGTFFFTQRDREAKDGKRDENRVQLDLLFDF